MILLDLPDYATLDKLEADEASRALGHRAGEWIFERHHSMFLRERMGPDLEYHPDPRSPMRSDGPQPQATNRREATDGHGRNDLLGEIAADAALERSDFLVQATEQLRKFLDANKERIAELGGLALIDEDPDYLSIAPDLTFRSRTRYLDDLTGEWVSETEVIETRRRARRALQPGRHLRGLRRGRPRGGRARRPSRPPRATCSTRPGSRRRDRRRSARTRTPPRPTSGRPASREPLERGRRRARRAAPVRPRARVPGAQPAQRGAPPRAVRGRGRRA